MTFEKNMSLENFTKSGTPVNAPVTQELLLTIFYPGTRLHDGAVIIKGDVIKAASVYYTPTTKPLTGKYGSRHRAAIGISEVCDAVTVVVSEETEPTAVEINNIRVSKGMKPIDIVVVSFVLAYDGNPISSTRIRRGEINQSGNIIENRRN